MQLELVICGVGCIAQLLHYRSCDCKVTCLISSTSGEFSSPEFTFCADSCSVSVPLPCVTAVAHRRPWSFCQKCVCQVIPKHPLHPRSHWLTALSSHSVATCQGNELTHSSSRDTYPQSCQLTEQLWTDPGLKSTADVWTLILLFFKKHYWRVIRQTFLQNPCLWGKSHHHVVKSTWL